MLFSVLVKETSVLVSGSVCGDPCLLKVLNISGFSTLNKVFIPPYLKLKEHTERRRTRDVKASRYKKFAKMLSSEQLLSSSTINSHQLFLPTLYLY